MKNKSGFTLVELLIVIVIIGILSVAILPKITGYMARTRDLKRQMDLKAIATAVEAYKNQHWKFPTMDKNTKYPTLHLNPLQPYVWATKRLKGSLQDYLKEIPQDPQKNNNLDLINHYCLTAIIQEWTECGSNINIFIEKGDYFYILPKIGENERRAILIAKVETPDMANYVDRGFLGWTLTITENQRARNVMKNERTRYFCSEITKGENMKIATKNNSKCVYTDDRQLRYIINID